MRSIRQYLVLITGAGLATLGFAGDDASASFHFANDIAPIFAKAGCSAAECHGGASGKGGFKLSLFSSDPRADFEAITREFDGRRIDFLQPRRSLLLRKPSRDLKHKGGLVLDRSDPGHAALLNWIEDGAPWSRGKPAKLVGLRIETVEGRITAQAAFRSGNSKNERDVTAMTVLETTDAAVATVAEDGTLHHKGPGEAWILARYGHLSARTPVVDGFGNWKPPVDSKPTSEIDRAWLKRLETLGLAPAEPAPEAILIRRLFFDLVGRPPSPLELSRFSGLSETVEALLDSDDFAKTWARHLGSWFEVPIAERDPRNGKEANESLRRSFHESMVRGDSATDIARRVFLEPDTQRAWKRFSDPRDRAEYIGRSMLGMRIGCARCHNHPLDRWKQEEHLRFSAFFSDDRPNPEGGPMMAGKFFEPETGRQVEPALLPLVESSPPDIARPEQLAWFVLDSGHDQFARNIANRVFGILVGRPLVDSPDDHRLSNPAVHESLLDRLTEFFIEVDYDLRTLIREVVNSRVYALSSAPGAPEELKFLARRESRRLSASEYRDAVAFVTGVEIPHPLPPDSPLAEQLYVMNSGLIQQSLATPGNQVDALFDFGGEPEAVLDQLYKTILSRSLKSSEKKIFLPELLNSKNPRETAKDLAFALLASREFGSIR